MGVKNDPQTSAGVKRNEIIFLLLLNSNLNKRSSHVLSSTIFIVDLYFQAILTILFLSNNLI